MTTDAISVRLKTRDEQARKSLERIISSVDDFRVLSATDPGPAELLILDIERGAPNEFEAIRSLLDTGTVSEIFLTSPVSDPVLLVQAMRSGAREFFSQPLHETEVQLALERFKERRERLKGDARLVKNGKVIDVIGSKGGVGNTTLAVNLAVSLVKANPQLSVALIDMNLLFGEIPLFLDIDPAYHWGEIAKNISRLDSTFLMSVLHRHSSGVFVLPSPSQIDGTSLATAEIIEHLLKLMKTVFDFIVVDSGHITEDISLKILEMSDEVFLTAILSLPCLSNVKRFLKLFYDLGCPTHECVKIIINRYMRSGDISLKDAEASIGRKIFWTIPNDFRHTMTAINQGKALGEIAPKSDISQSIRKLAEQFMEKHEDRKRGFSLFGKFLGNR